MAEYLIAFNDEWVPPHTAEEIRAKGRAGLAVIDAMRAAGVFVYSNGALSATSVVGSVRAVDGAPVFTDGPFAETKERLGGFCVVDVPDDEAARAWAARLAVALDWPQEIHRFPSPPEPPEEAPAPGRPRYLFSVFGPAERTAFGPYASKDEMVASFAATGAFNDKLEREGRLAFADGLEPATTATTVDGRGGRPVLTDGPYLETKEALGGFWVVEAADLDEALQLAAEASQACGGPVEVRPFQTPASVRALLE